MNNDASLSLLDRPFYFVRHGETESNLDSIVAGWRDVELTARGHEQAGAAAKVLAREDITTIYSSGLRRARDTAGHIAQTLVLPVTVIPELAERKWGALEGQKRTLRRPGVTPAGAETSEEFHRRIRRALARIDRGGTALIVAHSGVFRALCAILGIPDPGPRVGNAEPVRFMPPEMPGMAWTIVNVAAAGTSTKLSS